MEASVTNNGSFLTDQTVQRNHTNVTVIMYKYRLLIDI